jgi:predicted transcriptional regulator
MINKKDKISSKYCKECLSNNGRHSIFHSEEPRPVYFPGEIHHLDGDKTHNSDDNRAMICPNCEAHILLIRFSSEDIWLLKTKGLNNAQIGRLLGISRERVRQLIKRYQTKINNTVLSESEIKELVDRVDQLERYMVYHRRITKRMDKRTLKKRVIAALKNTTADEIFSMKDDLQYKRRY